MSLPYAPIKDSFEPEEVLEFPSGGINPPSYIFCDKTPSLCHANAIFVIIRDRLRHADDMKSNEFSWWNRETRSKADGVHLVGSVSSLPNPVKQIQKNKERSQHKSDPLAATQRSQKDELFALMLKCMGENMGNKENRFLRFAQGAKQALAFLADERQLQAVRDFGTNHQILQF